MIGFRSWRRRLVVGCAGDKLLTVADQELPSTVAAATNQAIVRYVIACTIDGARRRQLIRLLAREGD
ncbi:MAG: hypothetical protein WBV59_11880 [Anaerolineae bacterium]